MIKNSFYLATRDLPFGYHVRQILLLVKCLEADKLSAPALLLINLEESVLIVTGNKLACLAAEALGNTSSY